MLFTKKAKEAKVRKDYLADLGKFIAWLEEQINPKDFLVNWVQLGYDAHKRYFELVGNHPQIAVDSNCKITVSAEKRVYSWLDDECSWHDWDYSRMSQHHAVFSKQEEESHLFGNYSLSTTGPFGGGLGQPYACCAYLSYAYHEKGRWIDTLKALKTLAQ